MRIGRRISISEARIIALAAMDKTNKLMNDDRERNSMSMTSQIQDVFAHLNARTRDEVRQSLINAGIMGSDGKLTEKYRDDKPDKTSS